MGELPQGLGRFIAGDLELAVDDGFSLVALDHGVEVDEQSLADRIAAPGPFASWLLARLARLAGGTLALDEDTVEICEGCLFVIDFVVRRNDRPLGKVQLQAGRAGGALLGVISNELDPEYVVSRLVEALSADPDEVSPCRVRVRDPSTSEEATYGYDGAAYLS